LPVVVAPARRIMVERAGQSGFAYRGPRAHRYRQTSVVGSCRQRQARHPSWRHLCPGTDRQELQARPSHDHRDPQRVRADPRRLACSLTAASAPPTSTVDAQLPWLWDRAPDVHAVMTVLARRPPVAGEAGLHLPLVDLRGAYLGAGLADSCQSWIRVPRRLDAAAPGRPRMERERFARFIYRRFRALGGPAARAAFGGVSACPGATSGVRQAAETLDVALLCAHLWSTAWVPWSETCSVHLWPSQYRSSWRW
jgi:hypothetical protein